MFEECVAPLERAHVSIKQQRQLAADSERTLMECADPPSKGGSVHPISVLELTKNEADESSIFRMNVHNTAVVVHPLEYICWHIPRVAAQRKRGRVREDDWGLGYQQHVPHGVGAHVANVNHHPKPIHLMHHLFPKR